MDVLYFVEEYENTINTYEDISGNRVISINNIGELIGMIDRIIIPKPNIPGPTIFHQFTKQGFRADQLYLAGTGRESNLMKPYLECSYLPYLEFHVEDQCNLNCSACEHYAPLVKESRQPDFKKFSRDLKQLKKYIDEITVIRILGGEPLMNAHIGDYVLLVKEEYPNSKLRIVTNGLLLGGLSEEILQLIRDNDVRIVISLYPPMKEKINEIVKKLEDKGIEIQVSPVISTFYKRYVSKSTGKKDEEFERCYQRYCNNLYDGHIASCFLPFVQHYFNETFHMQLPSDGAIDLYDPSLTTAELKLRLSKPLERCNYCTAVKAAPWKQAEKEPSLQDWFIDA